MHAEGVVANRGLDKRREIHITLCVFMMGETV
jgi:hypothetical protein